MSALRLDLIVRSYTASLDGMHVVWASTSGLTLDRWTWRLWSGSRIVATSGSQLYSRRIDCVNGAEVGAGLCYVGEAVESVKAGFVGIAYRWTEGASEGVRVRIVDERGATS